MGGRKGGKGELFKSGHLESHHGGGVWSTGPFGFVGEGGFHWAHMRRDPWHAYQRGGGFLFMLDFTVYRHARHSIKPEESVATTCDQGPSTTQVYPIYP